MRGSTIAYMPCWLGKNEDAPLSNALTDFSLPCSCLCVWGFTRDYAALRLEECWHAVAVRWFPKGISPVIA